jgi:hypothetical protein
MLVIVSYCGLLTLVPPNALVFGFARQGACRLEGRGLRCELHLQVGAIRVMPPDCAIVKVGSMQGEQRQTRRGCGIEER